MWRQKREKINPLGSFTRKKIVYGLGYVLEKFWSAW